MTKKDLKQHKYNGLHVYCRLRDLKISKSIAKIIIVIYEKMVHWLLYKK